MNRPSLLGACCALSLLASTGSYAQDASRSVTIVLPSEPADLDPCNNTLNAVANVIRQNVTETLTYLHPETGEVSGKLATGWEQLEGGTWRVTLREGVKFHDGADFNAEAVKRAYDRIQNGNFYCVDTDRLSMEITSEVVDDHTIDITPNPPQLLMPIMFSVLGISSPNTPDTALTREPIGTGPFQFDAWTPDAITTKRFDGYWGEAPQIEQATYVVRGESALRAAMVEVGEADIALAIAPQDATTALDKSFPDGETTRIRMVMKPPLDDIRVRKAMNLAFDRDALIGTVLSADVVPAIQDFGPRVLGFDETLQPWPYDLDQAKALVAEAAAEGVPVDQEVVVYGRTGMFANMEEALQAMVQMWNDAGLNIRLEMIESGQWLPLVNKPFAEDRPVMLFPEMHDNNFGDASFTIPFRYHGDGQQAEINIPELNALIDKAGLAVDDERRSLFQQVNRYIAEQVVPDVKMYHMVQYMRVGDRLNFQPSNANAGQLELAPITFK